MPCPGWYDIHEQTLDTPFGKPSDAYVIGTLEGRKVAFLSRHGRGHRILPTELNFRANIYGFKQLGVERILSVSAVGSLKEEHKPLDFVIPDQFYDRTKQRISHFSEKASLRTSHSAILSAEKLPKSLRRRVRRPASTGKLGGTYVCMEGPQFSTKAESNLYRSWGFDVIGMTNLQEAKLAREAELCYATVAMVTDYDCWHPTHDSVTVDQIVAVLLKNAENACNVVREAVEAMPEKRGCKCGSALQNAILTDRQHDSLRRRGRSSRSSSTSICRNRRPSKRWPFLRSARSRSTPSKRRTGPRSASSVDAVTHFSLAASFFTEVRVVGVVGDDFSAEHEVGDDQARRSY